MVKKKTSARPAGEPEPMGPAIERNVRRLGHVKTTTNLADVAKRVTEAGKPMTRQRLAVIFKSKHVEPKTLEAIAKGLGVKPADLLKED